MTRFAVISFPGSNCDDDCVRVVNEVVGETGYKVRHDERTLDRADVVLLPGGFSFGDYLRCGAIARFSPIMDAVRAFAAAGGPVLGICNGFQILTEAGLLPGVLRRNVGLSFICEDTFVRVEGRQTAFTNGLEPGSVLKLPIAHNEGNYFADDETLNRLEGEGQVVFRYCTERGETGLPGRPAAPNGAARDIAGVSNVRGNIVGLMPHPERCCEPLLGGVHGRQLFDAVLRTIAGDGGPL
ncbi:MAG: phosphoribosylformylglycinamidine synthase subunit PurQ [Myxococcales bacterium]|nr:phosphoribosylformylglycinamidine synthase subunit PurQ [Myxococcales bacterium]